MTVGKPEVVVNGESRPLDVPPIVYHGVVTGADPRHLRRHGRVRAMGSGPPLRRGALRRTDAAADGAPPPPEATVAPPPPPPVNTKSADARRILPFVLLHATERVEQSGNPVQLFAGSEVQLERVNQATWNSAIAVHGDYELPRRRMARRRHRISMPTR